MRKPLALILLAVTVLPIATTLYTMKSVQQNVISAAQGSTFHELVIIQVIMIALLMAAYLSILAKSQSVPKDKKMLWAIALVVFNIFAMPVFWFHYIWKQPEYGSVSFQAE